jgi:hypothetical protein
MASRPDAVLLALHFAASFTGVLLVPLGRAWCAARRRHCSLRTMTVPAGCCAVVRRLADASTTMTQGSRSMNIDKSAIIAVLRARGLDAKADWVDRQLPSLVDTDVNRALLEMLEVEITALPAGTPPTS